MRTQIRDCPAAYSLYLKDFTEHDTNKVIIIIEIESFRPVEIHKQEMSLEIILWLNILGATLPNPPLFTLKTQVLG